MIFRFNLEKAIFELANANLTSKLQFLMVPFFPEKLFLAVRGDIITIALFSTLYKVLNRDNDDFVTTNSWKQLFRKIENH